MTTSRMLGLVAGVAAIALGALTIAAPASAATLPPGQKISIIDALDIGGPTEGPFFTVNPANAAATPVGTGSGAYTYGLEVNDDGIGFAIGLYQFDGPFVPTLWDADANSGTASNPRSLFYPSGALPITCQGIDLNPATGELLVACLSTTPNGLVSSINSVEKATGQLTNLASFSGDSFQEFFAIATNPVTGVLWGFGPSQGDASFIIDLALDTATIEGIMDYPVYAADFDRNGQLFLASQIPVEGEATEPSLAVTDPSSDDFTSNERLVNTADGLALNFVPSLSIWGRLAATGSAGAELLPVGLGSALLLLAGAAFIATSRMNRKTA